MYAQIIAKIIAWFFVLFPKEKVIVFIRAIVHDTIIRWIENKFKKKETPMETTSYLDEFKTEESLKDHLSKFGSMPEADWGYATRAINLSDEFLFENAKNIFWKIICERRTLSEAQIDKFADFLDFDLVSKNQRLTIATIRKYLNKFSFESLSKFQKLPEDFIEEFQNELDWYWVSERQTLSESCIRKFIDKVDMLKISIYQKLPESFIKEFQDKLCIGEILRNQMLTDEYRKVLESLGKGMTDDADTGAKK